MDTEQIEQTPVEQPTSSFPPPSKPQTVLDEAAPAQKGTLLLGGFFVFGILGLFVYAFLQAGSEKKTSTSSSYSEHPSFFSFFSQKKTDSLSKVPQLEWSDRFSEIEVTGRTATPEIREELNRIEQEGGLPNQVFREKVPCNENIAIKLSKELELVHLDGLGRLRKEITRSGDWGIDSLVLKKESAWLDTLAVQRLNIRGMLKNSEVKFAQELVKSENNDKEFVPNDGDIDFLWAYSTLEEFEIARALETGDIDAAVLSLLSILTLSELVSHADFPIARKHAVFLRENALRILQTLARHPQFGRKEILQIYQLLRRQLETWPDDAHCWMGDRASSLRVYELLRRGKIDDALEEWEKEELGQRNLLRKVAWMKPAEFNEDQAKYLGAMQKMIDSCKKPFYLRLQTLNDIAGQFKILDGTPEYPAIATLLIQGIFEGMQSQAEDRVRVEVWFLALATALNLVKEGTKEGAYDPLKGEKYVIEKVKIQDIPFVVVFQRNGFYKAEVGVQD